METQPGDSDNGGKRMMRISHIRIQQHTKEDGKKRNMNQQKSHQEKYIRNKDPTMTIVKTV